MIKLQAGNKLYYSAYYAVIALLLQNEHRPTTHNGAKSQFSEHFIKTKGRKMRG